MKSLPSVTPAFVKTLGHDLQRTIGNKNREQLILTAFLYDYYNNLLPPAITQNGNTRYANHQFTDCVESAIRTLFRFCTYNKKTKKFDPTFLQEKGLIQKVADFLKKETIDDTPQRHTDWASHVSNLNQISPDKPKIAYANATYELDGNLDNILKVISHFFPHDQNLIKLDQQIEKETHSLKKAELFKSKMDYVCSFLSREGFYLDWETNEKEKNLSYSIDTISHTEITVTAYSDEEKSRPITYFSWYLDKLHSEINRPYDQTLQRQANGLLNSENFSPWTIEVLKYFVPARTLEESLSKVSKSYPAEFIKFIFSMDIDEEETQDFISKSLQGLSSIPKTLIYFDRYFSYERYKSILPTTDHVLDFLENLVHPISLDLTEIQSMSDPQLDRLIEIIQDNDYRRNLKEILLPASVPAKTNISCIILKELANKEKTLSLPPESFSKDGFVKLRKYHSFFNIISLEDWENAPEDHLDWIMETFRESHFFDKFSFPRTSHEIQYSKIQKIILANQKKDLDQRTYLNVSSDIFYSDIWPNYSRLNIKTVEKLLKFFPFVKEWMIDELHYAQYYWNFSSGDLKKLLEQHSNVRIVWGLKDRYYHRVWSLGTQYNQPRVASFLDLEKELQREHYLTHINLTPSYLGFTLTPWQISELLPLIQKGVSLQSVELKLEDIGDLSPNSSILGPVFKLMNQGLIKKFSLTNSFFHMKHASSDIHHLLGKIANTVEELNLSGQVGIQPSDLEYFLKYKGFTSLQNLCFNYVALTPDVAKALAEFCQKTSNLKTLSWKGIDKDLWQDLYQYIIKIDNKYLTLEDVLFSDPSSKFLEKILTWSLESLDFSNQNLGDVSALKIAQIIKQRGEKNNLKEINLDNNALTAKGIEAFLETLAGSNITSLRLIQKNTWKSETLLPILTEFLQKTPSLESLSISIGNKDNYHNQQALRSLQIVLEERKLQAKYYGKDLILIKTQQPLIYSAPKTIEKIDPDQYVFFQSYHRHWGWEDPKIQIFGSYKALNVGNLSSEKIYTYMCQPPKGEKTYVVEKRMASRMTGKFETEDWNTYYIEFSKTKPHVYNDIQHNLSIQSPQETHTQITYYEGKLLTEQNWEKQSQYCQRIRPGRH